MVRGVCGTGLASPRLVADQRQLPLTESLRSAVRGLTGFSVVTGRDCRIHSLPATTAHSMSCGTPSKVPSTRCAASCNRLAIGRSASGPVKAASGRDSVNSAPVSSPETRASPSPVTTFPSIVLRSRVIGWTVNSTPASSAGTIAWMTTATSPMPVAPEAAA